MVVMAVMFVAFGVDGTNSYLHLFPGFQGLYEPNHVMRLLTGTGMGLVLALVLYPAFQQTVWRNWNPQSSINGLRGMAGLLGLALLLDLLVWQQTPIVLYPAALLSASGVVVLLGMVYTMVSVMIFRMENRSLRSAELALPLMCGIAVDIHANRRHRFSPLPVHRNVGRLSLWLGVKARR